VKIRKERLLPGAILLWLVAGLSTRVMPGYPEKTLRQEPPRRSTFYALEVVSEKNVQNAEDSLGEPDDRSAEILPGGQLVVLMKKLLSPSLISGYGEEASCVDSGSVVGKGEADFRLEGRFSWRDMEREKHYEWIFLVPSATGFCVSPPPLATYSTEDRAGVDMIRVGNTGTTSLFVDAVIGYEWML
jgi:hypothetical protein